MRRYFRVVDCSRHCGLPVRIACIILAGLAAVFYAFVLYFLPAGAAYPLMISQAVIGGVGLLACLSPLRIATLLYIIAQSLMIIPVWVVMGFCIYVLIYFGEFYCVTRYNFYSTIITCYGTDYEHALQNQGIAMLWVVIVVGFIGTIFSSISLQGFRKLKLHQAGVRAVQHGAAHNNAHCHQPATVVVQQPARVIQQPPTIIQQPVYAVPQPQQTQTTVYTTYATPQAYGAQPQVVNQSMYPTIPAQQTTNVYQY